MFFCYLCMTAIVSDSLMNKTITPNEYRQELRLRLLRVAMREFRSKGIKAVKTDDIANILSVSKRTMYETFENKEHLLMESVKAEYDGFDRHMQAFAAEKERHVMDFILETYRLHMESLKDTVPNYYADLRKYPKVLAWMEARHNEFQERTCRFFEQGVRQGYFRQDVNYELIYRVTTGSLIYIMENQMYKQYDLKQIFRDIVMLYFRGLCTKKGITELDNQIVEMS